MAILCVVLTIISATGFAVLRKKLRKKYGYFWDDGNEYEFLAILTMVILSVGFAIMTLIFGIWGIVGTVDSRYVDQKIQAYKEENAAIENDIDYIVAQYMEHESETFDVSKVESPVVLVQMYPELKSSELVSKQIDIYNSNNKKIKKLKLDKISDEKAKFYLYFGG